MVLRSSYLLAATCAITMSVGRVAIAQTAPARPNIVLILADDLGYSDVGCFGSEIHTPNIDGLAKQGVALTQFYNQARCCPTRATLMTGRWPHEVGIGDMIDAYAANTRKAANSPSYQDHLSTDSPTMAELLRSAGYRTMMCGKWHLGKAADQWPVHRGFDRSFVQINGAMNYFGGRTDGPREPMALDDRPFVPPHDGFYSTDAFTDHAIEFVDQSVHDHADQPFFLYLPYNAAHWPLQAPEADINRYAGHYDAGWPETRVARLKRMVELGIVPAGQELSPMDRGVQKPWDEMTDDQRKQWSRRMEVYAAQIDHMDQQIGRLLAELDHLGKTRDTIVLWLSDNGGAAEDPNSGDPNAEIGTRDSYRGYARPWATVSNTPWRHHKVTDYEGGISTPLVVRWPAGIPRDRDGTLVREPGHVIDLLPSFLELAGATYPTKPNGPTLDGQSITAMLKGGHGNPDRTFFWEHEGNRGVRSGKWMLCSLAGPKHPFELYDIDADRVQAHDVAADHPDVARRLDQMYQNWAARVGVYDRAPRAGDAIVDKTKVGTAGDDD
jgi:arylsulfatase